MGLGANWKLSPGLQLFQRFYGDLLIVFLRGSQFTQSRWYMCAKSLQFCPIQPHELQPSWLLCPQNYPGKNTRVVFHALLQGTFLTQGSNLCLLCLLNWQAGFLPLTRFTWKALELVGHEQLRLLLQRSHILEGPVILVRILMFALKTIGSQRNVWVRSFGGE